MVLENKNEYITSPYGYRIHPITGQKTFHYGLDIISSKIGTDYIVSPQNGVVDKVYYDNLVGNVVEIKHGKDKTRYCHLRDSIVKEKQIIKKGERIGYMGSTGSLSTGNHLHWEVYQYGTLCDPLSFFA